MFDSHEAGCRAHSAGASMRNYCAGIQQLLDEHAPLRQQMEELAQAGNRLLSMDDAAWENEIGQLLQMETKFKEELEAHSEKEEQGIFPLLGKHIGTEFGPIAVMEFEHREAKRLLGMFEELALRITPELTKSQTTTVVSPLIQACQILFDHFVKEENILFPMAENVLNEQEKAELLRISIGG